MEAIISLTERSGHNSDLPPPTLFHLWVAVEGFVESSVLCSYQSYVGVLGRTSNLKLFWPRGKALGGVKKMGESKGGFSENQSNCPCNPSEQQIEYKQEVYLIWFWSSIELFVTRVQVQAFFCPLTHFSLNAADMGYRQAPCGTGPWPWAEYSQNMVVFCILSYQSTKRQAFINSACRERGNCQTAPHGMQRTVFVSLK